VLVDLCLRLGRFRKDNKELLTYLLFEAGNEQAYVESVRKQIDEEFESINRSSLYFVKKSLRKIIRLINKYCRYSGIKETELELRLYFCSKLKSSGIPMDKSAAIEAIFHQQLKKIDACMSSIHEDLQYEYVKKIDALKG
jgi:hypothetical protein